MNKGNELNNAKIITNNIDWLVPALKPNLEQQNIIMNQTVKKMAIELRYIERSVFMTEVNTQNLWTSELGTQADINNPIRIFVIFQQSDRQHDQNLNNDSFSRMPVTPAQCIIGSEKYPDSGILSNHNDDDYAQGYSQVKKASGAPTEKYILQPYIIENDFRSSNDDDDIGYNVHIFDTQYQKNFESAQPTKFEFKIHGVIPPGIYGYALVLTIKILSISSDGQRHFDLI